jgi:hypothetical protein
MYADKDFWRQPNQDVFAVTAEAFSDARPRLPGGEIPSHQATVVWFCILLCAIGAARYPLALVVSASILAQHVTTTWTANWANTQHIVPGYHGPLPRLLLHVLDSDGLHLSPARA